MNSVNILQACLFSMLLFSSTVENVQANGRLYNNIIHGYKMRDPYITHLIDGDNGRINCVLYCLYKDCRTVGYNAETGQCQLFAYSIDDFDNVHVESNIDWELLYNVGKDDWEVLMRINAGSGVSPSGVWFGEEALSQDTCTCNSCNLPGNVECALNFRSGMIDNWQNINITQVKIEFFKNLNRVMFMTFDGKDSNSSSWFHNERYIDSSWVNFKHALTFEHFGIKSKDPYVGRTFDVSNKQNDCQTQSGWLVVLDGTLHSKASPGGICIWEKTYTNPTPTFMYSALELLSVVWKDVTPSHGIADTMVISFKRN